MRERSLFFILGVLPAAALQSIGAFIYFILLSGPDWAQTAYLIDKIIIISLLAFWLVKRPPIISCKIFQSWSNVLLGCLIGLISIGFVGLVAWLSWPMLVTVAPEIKNKISNFSLLTNYFVMTAVAFSLIHSLFEEWYWRWFVNKGLELYFSSTWAMVIGSLAFTAHHVIILSQFFTWPITIFYSSGVFLAGVIWTKLYKITGNLAAPWAAHALTDLVIFAVIYQLIK